MDDDDDDRRKHRREQWRVEGHHPALHEGPSGEGSLAAHRGAIAAINREHGTNLQPPTDEKDLRRREAHSLMERLAGPREGHAAAPDDASPEVPHASRAVGGDAPELAAAAAPRRVPPFPENSLRAGDELPIEPSDWTALLATPLPDGPRIVGPYARRAASVIVGHESFLVWIENRHIVGWMPAKELPAGGMRRGEWLLWSDGRQLQVLRDRPHGAAAYEADRNGAVDRQAERKAEAAVELDRDTEHFVASGRSIEDARREVEKAHRNELEVMVVATFIVMAGATPAEAPIEGLGRAGGRALAETTASLPKATADQRLLAELLGRSEDVVKEFPHLGRLAPSPESLAGMQRLVDLFDDIHIAPELRAQFLGEVKARVGKVDAPPVDLLREMRDVAYDAPDVYLRKGSKLPAEYLGAMGGLRRAISLKATLFNLTTDEFYARAWKESHGTLPKNRAKLGWELHAQELVELVRNGRVAFRMASDLRPDALVAGRTRGASGWYFSASDAGSATGSPATMQSRLAVGPEYADGYIIVELPMEHAVEAGAARPTALDLTLMPEGKLNPKMSEPAGRTNPLQPGQRSVREVVLPPLPLSRMSKITYVSGE